ncbi:phosphoglycolate phosphatase [Desulfonispora thiosulfatigenes DSM 11270]|uniref:Phosphoglycolate phosphatase n=1 Tax=Desulfonispora thiosulfatigenes DSM 11270 TaxID=656914 RepID=A0A1W1UIL2_DESTI|nr:HAD family hydrolase [Desulfonispora thiosulfatigenes]SMB80948.1 phosphoglycolate phosphatase [Desulfonispora thiosulfatigenes DSM 11270]
MKIKAVILDLDGTLFDSVGGIAYSLNKVLKENSLPTHEVDTVKTFVGNGIKKLVFRALPSTYRDYTTLEYFYRQMLDTYKTHWDYDFKFYEGMEDLLKELNERNIKIAVNTNKDHNITEEIAKKYLSKWDIKYIIGDRKDIAKKPDPKGAQIIMEKLEVSPSECLFVGDSEVDVETAHNANIKAIAVTWGFRDREMLQKADALIEHPMELLQYL